MEIHTITTGLLGVNTYVLTDKNKAIIIDSGENYEKVKDFISSLNVSVEGIYYTHLHFDHVGNAPLFQKDGIKIFIPKKDEVIVPCIGDFVHKYRERFASFTPDGTFSMGDVIAIGDIRLKVLETPGHTVGSVCFVGNGVIFSGDTLFYESVGRTDFPTGDFNSLNNSIKKLYTFLDNTIVYPGHGKSTTIEHEKKFNPYIKG